MYKRRNILRDRTFLITAGITILSILAISGGILLLRDREGSEETLTFTLADETLLNQVNNSDNILSTSPAAESTTRTETHTGETGASLAAAETATVSPASGPASSLNFSVASKLIWPIDTNEVIIEFSMDTTVYFPTLDKYKTSDAICIGSSVDTPVYAAADGIVLNIGYNEETGNNVSLDLGGGYTLNYGQLKDLAVSVDDLVSCGDLIGYVANPTKYYNVEGANLYLKLTLDGTSVNPLDYLSHD